MRLSSDAKGLPRLVLCSLDPWGQVSPDWRPFNYSVRLLESAIRADPRVSDAEVSVLDFENPHPDSMLQRVLELEPDIVGCSTYVWSFPTFVEFAKKLREARPRCAILFGGPSAHHTMFRLAPFADGHRYVDALAEGESEELICDVVAAGRPVRDRLKQVPGLRVATESGFQSTGLRPPPDRLDDIASPFQMGLIQRGMTAHMETYRGCPMSCAFCQWGELGAKGSRTFSEEYLVRELEAYRQAGVVSVFNIDPALNLNARAFRHLMAAEQQVGFFKERALTFELYPSFVTDEQLDFFSTLKVMHVGIGVDSFDEAVLARVNRKFSPKRFETVVERLHGVGRVMGHLIMGLPGDTPAGFKDNVRRLQDMGVGLTILHCLVLPNALLSRVGSLNSGNMKFDPITLKMISCDGWTESDIRETCEYLTDLSLRSPTGMQSEWMWQWDPAQPS